jgi:diguanylate cyclase (GGDEF)-like protein
MQDELRLRTRMIGAGIHLSAVSLLGVGVWIWATWSQPHRGGLTAMAVSASITTAIIAAIPRARIINSRHRELLFLAWSLSLVAFISVAAGLDEGVRSPMVLMLYLTLVYAALSYPRWAVAVVSAVSLLAVVTLSVIVGTGGRGAHDPYYLGGLVLTLSITGTMCIWQSRLQHAARAELARISRADPLTGCLNRLGFGERLDGELARVRAGGPGLALVVVDFDGFKAVNDQHGHSAGDDLLCWATHAMAAVLRPGDALGRLGGDEFAALLPDADIDEACRASERLRFALAARISASAGVAAAPEDGTEADPLHHRADERLYEAKRQSPSSARRRTTNSRSSSSTASSMGGGS